MSSDKTIKCRQCEQEFVWTVGEQDFYRQNTLPDPIYCMICRAKKEAELRFWKRDR